MVVLSVVVFPGASGLAGSYGIMGQFTNTTGRHLWHRAILAGAPLHTGDTNIIHSYNFRFEKYCGTVGGVQYSSGC